jgi:hypothetical protein
MPALDLFATGPATQRITQIQLLHIAVPHDNQYQCILFQVIENKHNLPN